MAMVPMVTIGAIPWYIRRNSVIGEDKCDASLWIKIPRSSDGKGNGGPQEQVDFGRDGYRVGKNDRR